MVINRGVHASESGIQRRVPNKRYECGVERGEGRDVTSDSGPMTIRSGSGRLSLADAPHQGTCLHTARSLTSFSQCPTVWVTQNIARHWGGTGRGWDAVMVYLPHAEVHKICIRIYQNNLPSHHVSCHYHKQKSNHPNIISFVTNISY